MVTERTPDISDARDYMGGMGNISFLWEFVDYFEKKIEKEITPYGQQYEGINISGYAYLNCPNFAAGLRFYTELICNKALVELCRAEKLQTKIEKYSFKSTVKKIIEITEGVISRERIALNEFEKMKKAIKMVVELRHTLQHGGIPYILRDVSFKEIDEKEVAKMMVPQNYKETKEIFQDANRLIELLPRPIIIMHKNGRVKLKEHK